MKNGILATTNRVAALMLLPTILAHAQVPVDDDGNVIGDYARDQAMSYSSETVTGNEDIPLLSPAELEELVGPVALYPDDLLAVVLPAATYPLQVVQAARFLDDLETDPGLEPNPDWDDSIVALINYPEVVELLNEDLDWTWRLGEAVVAQQADVVSAVESFRDRAYAAGNLKSDSYQTVSHDDGIIEITPVNDEIIYVPYYEPARVVYRQPRPVYYYYPRPCPVYYYPYPSGYAFRSGFFWGVTTAFSIGWHSDHLRVFHHSYRGHPFFGVRYWDRWWYRRPSIHVHNNIYVNNSRNVAVNRYSSGDRWRPSRETRLRSSDQRISRSVHYPNGRTTTHSSTRSGSANRTVTRTPTANGTRQARSTTERRRIDRGDADARRNAWASQREQRSSASGSPGTVRRAPTNAQREQRSTSERRRAERGDADARRNARASQRERRSSTSGSPGTVRRAPANTQREQRSTSERRSQRPQTAQRRTSRQSTAEHRPSQRRSTRRESTPHQRADRSSTERRTTQRASRQSDASSKRQSTNSRSAQSEDRRGSTNNGQRRAQRESTRRR